MTKTEEIFNKLLRLKTLAQTGVNFKNTLYDEERYAEILGITDELLSAVSGAPLEKLKLLHEGDSSYITPKVDVRCLIKKEDQLLFIREKADGLWALPGGWADVGFSPAEVAAKEAREETGLEVEVMRLLAVFDNRRHNHPPALFHVYKMFFVCKITGGDLSMKGHEALEVGFFSIDNLPPLSGERNTGSQIKKLWSLMAEEENLEALFD